MSRTTRAGSPVAGFQALCFEDLALGQRASLTCAVTEADVQDFAEVGDERAPIQLCDEQAAETRFGQRIAHGMFTTSLVSTLLGTRLPGPGAVHLSQTFQFLGPVRVGEVVAASVEIVELVPARGRARVFCDCAVDGRAVLEGEAWIQVPRRG